MTTTKPVVKFVEDIVEGPTDAVVVPKVPNSPRTPQTKKDK